MNYTVSVEMKGPIFQANAPHQVIVLRNAVVQELVELGEQRLASMLRPRPAGVYLSVAEAQKGKASTGNYRRNLYTRAANGVGLLTDSGVIYGPWLEGVGTRNQTTRFKGYASFRRTAQWLQQQVRKVMDAYLAQFRQRMN